MNSRVAASWVLWGLACAPANAGVLDCIPRAEPVDVVLRTERDARPTHLKLSGGQSPSLKLVDPADGSVRWSAGAAAPALQIFPAMWAGFAGSLAVLDLDGDGTHDRIYAGDLAGRLWRFDIHHGAGSSELLTGGIFAALGGGPPAVRAFVAPADVSLAGPPSAPWLNLAIGTATLASADGDNRFYVLRDRSAFGSWSRQQYLDWTPITEARLTWRNPPGVTNHSSRTDIEDAEGFYVTIGRGSVVTASITVSGRATVAVANDIAGSGSQCTAAVTISRLALDAEPHRTGEARSPGPPDLSVVLPGRFPATESFRLESAAGEAVARCRFGTAVIDDCAASLRLQPVWWRRDDAD